MRAGFLVIEKGTGLRSTACVTAVRKLLWKGAKVGHGGTLDSTASGILVLLVGKATRTSGYVMALPKVYDVVAKFGLRTSTDDISGEIIARSTESIPDNNSIDRAILSFTGLREQVPPAVSAIRVSGERAHYLARRGEKVVIPPRPVFIESIERIGDISSNGDIRFRIRCQKGTYIRSLVRDLGDLLLCGATVVSLARESIGPFSRSCSMSSDLLDSIDMETILSSLLPVISITSGFTTYRLDPSGESDLISGKKIPMSSLERLNWGGGSTGNTIVVSCLNTVSFGRFSAEGSSPYFSPVTTIGTGDE